MKQRMFRLVVCASIMSLVFWLTACGGSSGSDGGSAGVTYTGETSAATIDADNAGTLAGGALDAGSSNSAFGMTELAALSAADPAADGSGQPLLVGIARTLEDAVGNVDFSAASEPDVSAAQAQNGTITGNCGEGTATYSVSVNTTTGGFSGNFTFNAFCADGTTVSGGAGFSGTVNTSTNQLESFIFTFSALTATSGSESVTMNGSVAISAASSTITMNLTIQNNTTGWNFKVVDYQMIVTDNGLYSEYSISGRFYDQDYGYVDLVTTVTLSVDSGNDYPSSGELTLYGEIGTGGLRTSAVLTADDATHCHVDVDADGDGIYEVTGPSILWTEL